MSSSSAVQQITLYTVCIPVILVLCLLAAVCNVLVLLARFQIKNRSSALELTFSLAASDTWTSVVVAASLFRNSYMPVVLGIHYSSICFPLTLEVFRTGGLLTGLLHLSTLAVYHVVSIMRPFDHNKLLNHQRTVFIIILIWVIPPLSLFLYFSAWPNQGYRAKNCLVVEFYDKLYFRLIVSILIISLMVATGLFYWKLLSKLKESCLKSSATSRKRRTIVTSGLIFGTFLIGWLPASLLYVLTAQGMPLHHVRSIWLNIFALTTLVLIMVKSFTNPIIYATRIPEIRQLIGNRRDQFRLSGNRKLSRQISLEQQTMLGKT